MLNVYLFGLIVFICSFFPMPEEVAGASLSTYSNNQSEEAAPDKSLPGKPQKGGKAQEVPDEILSPEQTVDSLMAKSSNWQEPSRRSEERYKKAIHQWLDSMQPTQRQQAFEILRDAHPDIHNLRAAIRDKKRELANMSFNRHTSPESLPRLGQELQSLRKQLRAKLEIVSQRLRQEAGVTLGPLEGDAYWLLPQDLEAGHPVNPRKTRPVDKANSKNSLIPMFSMN